MNHLREPTTRGISIKFPKSPLSTQEAYQIREREGHLLKIKFPNPFFLITTSISNKEKGRTLI
jgi:hypothetical protein